MPQTQTLPSPVAQWEEPAAAGLALALTSLVPWLDVDGSWLLLTRLDQPPVGAVQGAWIEGPDGSDLAVVSTTMGKRITLSPSGDVLAYGQPQLFRYEVGDSLGGATFSRADVGTYDGNSVEPVFAYVVGGSLAGSTFTRSTTGTYVGEV